ncbi:MAB_1171c family putative transporter [Amycolatopsis keratiniphila]|uniref:DUF6545 domain-containing protein n=1 Tax=Amycolatopsis keratiniphila subsp. keratiniphila TaxID=227715 RepID=A0A1W2M384_9PSEU|nr:MAB_1171c family putative transporter [Amycolatopsis keratiniphila]OLZ58456.1 hypothetical protein BS330_11415 [Amycolatopsis keratiniphila subsp. nogabecina]ONF74450.1 hypothetical protein AVR91_0204005 [Amycolatopsis keratiniphila subsp. keratiniphila]SDU01121.1 hypothetical protein SAMN04489733_0361 [Amycolatopsis keratiniphila]
MSLAKEFVIAALVWFSFRLARSPRDPAIWALVGCLVLRLLTAPSTMVALHEFTGGTLDVATFRLVQTAALDASLFCLLVFFLLSAGGSRRRVALDAWLLMLVCAALAVAMVVVPAASREQAFGVGAALPSVVMEPGVALFFLVDAAYGTYTTVQAASWALRDAVETPRRVRWGLRIAACGLITLAVTSVARFGTILVRWSGGDVPSSVPVATAVLVHVGIILFMAGITMVGLLAVLAAARLWLRHRRRYEDLRPLWGHLHDVFPGDALYAGQRGGWLEELAFWRMHRRYWRRVVEIRDGLVRLSPYLADCGAVEGRERVSPEVFREALARLRAGERPSSRTAVAVARPEGPDVEADVGELVTLSKTLRA